MLLLKEQGDSNKKWVVIPLFSSLEAQGGLQRKAPLTGRQWAADGVVDLIESHSAP